jgi:hypothetical protein
MKDQIAIPLVGATLLGAALWASKEPRELTEAQSRRRIEQLKRQSCEVFSKEVPGVGVVVMKRCP